MSDKYSWLGDATSVDNGAVITASRRLARELREAHNEHQIAAGRLSWATPQILFLGDWLDSLVDSAPISQQKIRLSSNASNVLWEQQLKKRGAAELPGLSGVVRQCVKTWQRLHEWRVAINDVLGQAIGSEQRLFAGAADGYRQMLVADNALDSATIFQFVASAIEDGLVAIPPTARFVGFDRISPAVRHLFDALQQRGSKVETVNLAAVNDERSVQSFADRNAELRAAGLWACGQLEQDPDLRLAIICPDLETQGDSAARLIREGFAPGWQLGDVKHRHAVNVSYGRRLADFPPFTVALLLLRWPMSGLSSTEVSILLRSHSIIGGGVSARSRLEMAVRRLPDQNWPPSVLLGALGTTDVGADAEIWRHHMRHVVTAESELRTVRSASEWAEYFDRLLADAGWPGSHSLDSEQFQLINRWRELLNEFARLESVLPPMRYGEAASRIAGLAGETVFQPEAETSVLPVMGMLEAAGFEFDALWVTGFDSSNWPGSGNPLAYVSRQLQIDNQMPDSSPTDTLEFSQRVADRLCLSSRSIRFSWAATDGSADLGVSHLAQELELKDVELEEDPGWYASLLLDDSRVLRPDMDPVRAVRQDEVIGGGAYSVQRQATDPFSAFAYGRLRVSELQTIQPGISASARGSIIHQCLKLLYADVDNQDQLKHWGAEATENRIEDASRTAINPLAWHSGVVLKEIVALEQTRLKRLLHAFVATELQRPPFEVAMVERALVLDRHGIRLNLRVDRVDRNADGSLFVIDYKSGAEKSLTNRDGDLQDLQLAVYALAMPEPVGALAIINLDSRNISMRASATGDKWDEQYPSWCAAADVALQMLSEGFAKVNVSLPTARGRSLNVLSRFEELRNE